MHDATTAQGRRRELTGAVAIAAVATLIGVMFMASTLPTPLYRLYEQTFHFSRLSLTLVYATYALGNLLALSFGRWSDTIGRRPVSLLAIAIGCLSTLLYLFATGTAWLFGARAASGLAIGLLAGTATAWIAELDSKSDKGRATTIAISSNFAGLGMGALLAGLLAQYAPWPLHLSFVVYLGVLLVAAAVILHTYDTSATAERGIGDLSLRPRIGVPRSIRARFISPAATAFSTMALAGFYAALIPGILSENLGETNRAVAGAVVFELAIIVAITGVLTRQLESRIAMLSGLALLLPGLALLVAAQTLGSMALLFAGTALSGLAIALGYRGSLQVVNQIAPADRRAEVVSAYLVAGFAGNALPVIGVGMISNVANSKLASLVFAATIAGFAIAAIVIGLKFPVTADQ
jgi:MFS family permease